MICLEELVGEVLCHEGKHQIGPSRVRSEFVSLEEALDQHAGIRENRSACIKRTRYYLTLTPLEKSHLC